MHRGGYGNRSGHRGSTWAFGALCALAAALPLELREPLFSLGPVAVTNVELLLYVAVGLWAVSRQGRPRSWTAVHWAALGWSVALGLSAAFAAEHREAAAKFALRQLGGVALGFATADAVGVPSRAALLLWSYAAGAVLSGLCGVAEAASPAVAVALSPFKTQPSLLEGMLRASGTFQYANLAAMAWGMALPVAVALWAAARGRPARVLAAAGTVVLVAALVASASRAGLLTAVVVLGGVALLGRDRLAPLRGRAVASLAAVLGLAGLDLATGGGLALRLRDQEDRSWFEVEVRPEKPLVVDAGGDTTVTVRARNVGRLRWQAAGEHRVALGYRWLTEPGERVRVAATLLRDVAPGDSVTLEARVRAPGAPGRQRLAWLLTGDGLAWVGPEATRHGGGELVEVRPSRAGAAPESAVDSFPLQRQPTRPALWRAGLSLWAERPLVGVGPDNFRRLYSRRLGPHVLDERVHANSLYVEVLSTLGLLGALAFLCLGTGIGLLGVRAVLRLDPRSALLAAGALAGLGAFCVHGVVDYGLEATSVYGSFWLLTGLVAGMSPLPSAD